MPLLNSFYFSNAWNKIYFICIIVINDLSDINRFINSITDVDS